MEGCRGEQTANLEDNSGHVKTSRGLSFRVLFSCTATGHSFIGCESEDGASWVSSSFDQKETETVEEA